MKFEFSAGGIVYNKQKARSKKQEGEIRILVAQHSQHHGWVFPKGLIDKGESKEQAALREVLEETGINGRIVKPVQPVTYWYVFEGEKIKKTVYYFLMEYISGDTTDHDFEMEQVEWTASSEVEKRLSYKSDKMAWLEARKLIGIK